MTRTDSRILLVGPDATAAVSRRLRADATVQVVDSAAACLSALSSMDVNCVVTTDDLPETGCVELCTRIRDGFPAVPIVVLASDGSEALAGELVAAGIDGYVPRSQGLDALVSRVSDVIEAPESEAEPARSGSSLDGVDIEEQLRVERDRFAALFENVPDAVVVGRHDEHAAESIIEAVNPAFERIFGHDESELVGEPLDQFIVPPEKESEAETFNRLGSQGEVLEAEVTRRAVDGLREFIVRVVPMETDGTSDQVFGVYTDITERKRRQKRVEILNRVLRHDLRNGMNVVDGCAEQLADTASAEDAMYVETIQERAADLVDLAEKTRAAERTLERSDSTTDPIDLCGVARRAIARLEQRYPDADVSYSLPERRLVRADKDLETAIFQVLENAAEHNDLETPAIDISLRDRPDDELIRLSVADDGPGISDEERALLEEDEEITQLRHTSGLGLWLVKWVVTQSGGRLCFGENEPRGTIVTVEIPRAAADSSSIPVDEDLDQQ
ncbi:PAS domain S-box protein [Natrialbaceae archaeon A-arb3/5]